MKLLHPMFLSPELQTLGWALVHSLWLGVLVGLALAGMLRLGRSWAPESRYTLACAALLVLFVLPIAVGGQILPIWREHEACWALAEAGQLSSASPEWERCLGHGLQHLAAGSAAHRVQMPPPPNVAEMASLRLTGHFAALAILWLTAVLFLAARTGYAVYRLRRLLAADPLPVEDEVAARVQALRSQLGIRRPVRVIRSVAVAVPAVAGWRIPTILVPATALDGLAREELDMVLLHELAHVRRLDFLVNLVQTLVETTLFYHPVSWWISRRIREEREYACDEIAAALRPQGVPRYLRALLALEGLRRGATETHALAITGGVLLPRVRRLALAHRNGARRTRSRWRLVGAAAGILALSVPLLETESWADLSAWAMMTRDIASRPPLAAGKTSSPGRPSSPPGGGATGTIPKPAAAHAGG